jgi:hypothetical protein
VLSAMCMLFGVFAINDSLDWSPLPVRNLLTMIVTLNVYEVALIALAMVLLKLDVRRDALLLLIIEAFFLADVGFLNMEVFTVNYHLGLIVNVGLLVAAVIKLAVLFKAAGLHIFDGMFLFVVTELAVLFAVPGIFAVVAQPRSQVLPPLAVFGAWWLAGFLPVAFVMSVGSFDVFARPVLGWNGIGRIVARVLIALPMLSLLAHLCLANWVYKVTFHPSNVAPLLLGVAVAVGRIDQHLASFVWRMRMSLVLPFVAIGLAALKFPKSMIFDIAGVSLSPLRIVLLAAMVVYLDGLWLFRMPHFAIAAMFCLATSGLGHNVATMNENSLAVSRWWVSSMKKLVPTTVRQWGIASVMASFVLLGMGAVVSLWRRKTASEEEVKVEPSA